MCVEQTSAVFEQLCRLVKCVVNPGDCGSAERCVLAQLHDLYKAAAHLCHAPHADTFANAYPKIKYVLQYVFGYNSYGLFYGFLTNLPTHDR